VTNSATSILVIGATGFLGRRVVAAGLAEGRTVRAMARQPAAAADLGEAGAEVVQGDLLDLAAVGRAVDGMDAVVVCVHTISRQTTADKAQGFMDVEATGLRNVIAACRAHGVRRVMYVTSIGVGEHAASSWLRGRWQTEQELLTSGLDATIVRPGMIVGRGGDGFSIVARGGTRRFAMAIGNSKQRFRTISADDLAHDMLDLIDKPEAVGREFEVGSDDVLTMREMMAIVAGSRARRPARTLFVRAGFIRAVAPLAERLAGVPRGALRGFVGDGPQADMAGDPRAVREVLHRTDRPFREAIEGQVG
jgi:uncharacterized protein YbjT (DUF2867 family)